jgi:hypothetical protein
VVATDVNNDGLLDLFVANDTVQNFLFMNRGQGKWEEIGLPSEVGFSMNGQPRSGMGVDAADVDGDGWQDLFVANVDNEMFALYRNNRDESFSDVANSHGIGQATRLLSGWGLKFFDFDNDGLVDLFLANGHPDDMVDSYGGPGPLQGAAAPLPQRRHAAARRERAGRARVREVLPRARPRRRRLRQRRRGGRARGQQRRRAAPAAQPRRGRAALGRPEAGREGLQSRRGGRAPHLVGGRRHTLASPQRWRELPLLARPARGDRPRSGGGARLAGDPMARPSGRVERIKDVPIDRYLHIVEGRGIAG